MIAFLFAWFAAAAVGAGGTRAPTVAPPPTATTTATATRTAPEPVTAASTLDTAAYRAEIETWRRERETRLRAPDGWLTLVGLTWLRPGENRFGSAADDAVRLPPSVPPHAGRLLVQPGVVKEVKISFSSGVSATINGRPSASSQVLPLRSDAPDEKGDSKPDIVALGKVTVQIIERGGRLGARVKDPDSDVRRRFTGLAWFPIDPAYRVRARLVADGDRTANVASDKGEKTISIPDSSGGTQTVTIPGRLVFTLLGKELALVGVRESPADVDLLVVFRDATAGRETYGAGRFVRAIRESSGGDGYLIDFNRAYTPPCGFTPYATCPLPPPENRPRMAIRAGEKAPPGTSRPH